MKASLKSKIINKSAKIGIIGLGYVGLPLAIEFSNAGFEVIGIDKDKDRVNRIKRKESYITGIDSDELKKINIKATDDFSALKSVDVIIICVPTPLRKTKDPDISFIVDAVEKIAQYLRKGQLIILESTTYPGTTEELILSRLNKTGKKAGRDFFLVFSPERIDPGNKEFRLRNIPKVVGGIDKESTELAKLLYEKIINKVIKVSSPKVAEMVKLLENTFRIVNIGLINEIALLCNKIGIDVWEVIEAAKSKPFGFMPFYPGPGIGGHCLAKNEILFVKDRSSLRVIQMPDFIRYFHNAKEKDKDVEVLSFDIIKKQSIFKKVKAVSARPYRGQMIHIATEDGRHLDVTDLHPIFAYNHRWHLKYAKDLERGDCLPVCLKLPTFGNNFKLIEIDLLEEIKQKKQHPLIEKTRVKPKGFLWKDYAKEIKYILRKEFGNRLPDICWDYFSGNYLPLKYFYTLENLTIIDHQKLKLVSGRGPSYSEIPARIAVDEAFCRLIGYYLSEGCYTKDKSARIRFSFNRNEVEYIQDVVKILSDLGIRSSIYNSRRFETSCIKVSSNLFGLLIYDVLKCGTNSYNMNIPEQFISLGKEQKMALLSGMLRGDGCVEYFFGKRRYYKNGKEYFHSANSACVSFFTSSRKLFQQLIILVHDLDIVPTFLKRKYGLRIFGYKQLAFCKDLFDGKKKSIIEKYLILNKRKNKNKTFKKIGRLALVKIKSIISSNKDCWVYSIETNKPHTFVTSYGIAVHNCIPADPLYLSWKAKEYGFEARFIELASQINSYMPEFVVEKIASALNLVGKPLKNSKILIIGVTYKADVKDLRESPSLEIIEKLKYKGVGVSYFDPLIPYLKIDDLDMKSKILSAKILRDSDCVVIVTPHASIDYRAILKNSRLIVDTRNVFKAPDKKIIKL